MIEDAGCLKLDKVFSYKGEDIAWGRMGEGPGLVLVHGTPFSSQVWRRIAPLLATRFTVYFYDLLGYGQSGMHDGQDVSLSVQNGLLAALLTHWGLRKPHVLAHDFGGATVLRGHYLNGLDYASLTLFDVVALRPWGSDFVTHIRDHEAAFAGLPAYAHDALVKAYLEGAAHSKLTREALEIYMRPWRGATGQAAFYRQIAQMDLKFTDAVEPLYAPMGFPVQMLWGEQDAWIPIERGEKLAKLLGAGPLKRVRHAGHLMQEDAPEAIIAAMAEVGR